MIHLPLPLICKERHRYDCGMKPTLFMQCAVIHCAATDVKLES